MMSPLSNKTWVAPIVRLEILLVRLGYGVDITTTDILVYFSTDDVVFVSQTKRQVNEMLELWRKALRI